MPEIDLPLPAVKKQHDAMPPEASADAQRASVEAYYGKTLQSTADLKTSACCPIDAAPAEHQPILNKIHPEVRDRFYGCGSPIPDALKGVTLLDLGCGTGRDAYLASALVGPQGRVIGVDMTQEQLDVAEKHRSFHAEAFFGDAAASNVSFRKGVIEDLAAAGVEDASVDVVISNCVCNLSPDKPAVFREVARVLREGGEFYFSDIYADRRLSPEAMADEELVGECLGGALYIQDFRRVMADVGLPDVRIVSSAPVLLHDERMLKLVPGVRFYSVTVRAFKIATMEDRAENYQQTATYTGCCASGQKFDSRFSFRKGKAVPVDSNTAEILTKSRYSKRFRVTERGKHRGLADHKVEAGAIASFIEPEASNESTNSCCPPKEKAEAESCCAPSTKPCCPPASPSERSGSGCC